MFSSTSRGLTDAKKKVSVRKAAHYDDVGKKMEASDGELLI